MIADLPFVERDVLSLLNLDADRDEPEYDYAGYGWARVPRIWLVDDRREHVVEDALVLALHTADDAPVLADDLELELDVPDGPVAVRASKFLSVWLPKLPRASAVVMCVCNPHNARLAPASCSPMAMWMPTGDVTSWIDRETGDIKLVAQSWSIA